MTAYGIIAQNCQTGDLTSNVQFDAPPGSDGDDNVSLQPSLMQIDAHLLWLRMLLGCTQAYSAPCMQAASCH